MVANMQPVCFELFFTGCIIAARIFKHYRRGCSLPWPYRRRCFRRTKFKGVPLIIVIHSTIFHITVCQATVLEVVHSIHWLAVSVVHSWKFQWGELALGWTCLATGNPYWKRPAPFWRRSYDFYMLLCGERIHSAYFNWWCIHWTRRAEWPVCAKSGRKTKEWGNTGSLHYLNYTL